MMGYEVCFGNVELEEPNIAYSVLKSVKKVSLTELIATSIAYSRE